MTSMCKEGRGPAIATAILAAPALLAAGAVAGAGIGGTIAAVLAFVAGVVIDDSAASSGLVAFGGLNGLGNAVSGAGTVAASLLSGIVNSIM